MINMAILTQANLPLFSVKILSQMVDIPGTDGRLRQLARKQGRDVKG